MVCVSAVKALSITVGWRKIEDIETRGKALLTHFSNGLTMYSHNQLYGVWKIVDAGETQETKRDQRVSLDTEDKAKLIYSESNITIAQPQEIAQHPFIQRLGPVVLELRLKAAQVKESLMLSLIHIRRSRRRG